MYNKETLIHHLGEIEWETEIEEVQEMWNHFEQDLLSVIDRCAPVEISSNSPTKNITKSMKKLQNRRSHLLRKRCRKTLSDEEKSELKSLNKSIKILTKEGISGYVELVDQIIDEKFAESFLEPVDYKSKNSIHLISYLISLFLKFRIRIRRLPPDY